MAGTSPVRNEYLRIGSTPDTALNDEYYGRRMQMLMNAGAGRFLEMAPDSIVALASGPDSDEDMMDVFYGAFDQSNFNMVKQRFQSMPTQMQRGEFNRLPKKMQELLRGAGYEFPEEKDPDGLLKRIFTWDIPLLPEEHFGTAVKVGMSPIRALGFGMGMVARNVWEFGVMKPSRYATRLGRSFAFLDEKNSGAFLNPARWREAWNKPRLEDGSYYQEASNAAIEMVGADQTDLLKIFIRDGGQGVYDHFEDTGKAFGYSDNEINERYQRWYEGLAEQENVEALEVLESGRLTLATASVRSWNKYGVWDVTPGTKPAAAIRLVGSLAAVILLDPTSWVGGFYTKILRAAKFGRRTGQSADFLDVMRRGALVEREAAQTSMLSAFKPARVPDVVDGGYIDAHAGIKEWMKDAGVRMLGRTDIVIRNQFRAINRMTDRVNDAFRQWDEIDAFKQNLRETTKLDGDGIRAAVTEEFGPMTKIDMLLRDLPALNVVIDSMRQWHMTQRRTVLLVDEDTGELIYRNVKDVGAEELVMVTDGSVPTLADEEGFWSFLADNAGWRALAKPLGGTSPEALFIPRIGRFGAKWMERKQYMREILDLGENFPLHIKADIARMPAQYIAKQTDYVHAKVFQDITDGTLKLSVPIDEDMLSRVMLDPQMDQATRLGLSPEDHTNILEHMKIHESNASQIILEDSELDDLLNYYLNDGFEVRLDEKGVRRLMPVADIGRVPFAGAGRAFRRYYQKQIHPPGSQNAELTWLDQTKAFAKAGVAGVAYYPARFAEKLTTYTPTVPWLDVTDSDTAVKEFTALVDMGVMAHMPRTQIDQYIRTFVMGNESERWLVQHDFFLDFIGRTGALVHGGRDVQDFIQRFIRHGNQRYAQLSDDVIGIRGLSSRRAIMPGAEFGAQLAKSNIIPNYRELAAMARYTAFYRMAGWGLHLPEIDKFISRTWRPAVLLRLGYVPRNGGEELFSWWLREGPKHWVNHKIARAAIGKHVIFDEYGRKILKDISDEERLPLIWKPFSRIWRSFNEIGGVGYFAVTKKAVKKSIKENPRWKYLSADEQAAFFDAARVEIKNEVEDTLIGGTSRRLFEIANAKANELTLAFGSGISRDIAQTIGRRIDSRHDERVRAITHMMTDPTILDQQMKDILGTFDPYIGGSDLDMTMRDMEFGHVPDARLQLPMKYGQGELTWVSVEAGQFDALPRSVAVAQRTDYMRDDPAHKAFLGELIHYVSPPQEETMLLLAQDLGLSVDTSASAAVLTYFRSEHPDALRKLAESFDLVPSSTDVDSIVEKVTMHDAFVDALPTEIQDAVRRFLKPASGVDQNPNVIAFLISHADPTMLSPNLDDVVVRAKRAFVNEMLTPQGEQLGRAAHMANIGFDEHGGLISDALPPGAARLFVPMVPVEYAEEFARILSDTSDAGFAFYDEFVDRLAARLELIGIKREEAYDVAQILQPSLSASTVHRTPSMYMALAGAAVELGQRHLPLTATSANPAIADAVAKTLTEMLGSRVGLEPNLFAQLRAGVSSLDVNAEEIFGVSPTVGRQSLNGPTIPVARGNVRSSVIHPDVAVRNQSEESITFFGIKNGVPTASSGFGPNGLGRKNVIGVAGEHLFPKLDGELQRLQMLDDMPVTYTVHHWRHKKSGRTVYRRQGDERNTSWYGDGEEWELLDSQIVASNDFHAAMEDLAERNTPEILDLLSSGDRAADTEIFLPWIREITTTDEISPVRINGHAEQANWWDKSPQRILGLLPPTDQAGGLGERIASGWNTILRNWFDGVVNPMIGAMVREPMFQHYYVIAAEQVAGVKRNYNHTPYAYANLGNALGRKGVGTYDDAGQLVIEELTSFIELNWQVARLDPDALISKVAFAVENGNRRAFLESVTELLKAADDPKDAAVQLSQGVYAAFDALRLTAKNPKSSAINEFFEWASNRKLQFETHRSVALQRAMTLTGAFIDDHRIRSQFQEMVGSMIPFWFAEDQFLRRLGRGLKHNPLMLRNLHLTMNAGVRGGLVQEDQFGEKKLVVPGSEVLTTAVLEIADRFPIVNAVFGGPLGAVARPKLAMNINIIPGYDLDQMGQMGFGPLLAAPINYASGRDPSLRAKFEHNLVGGRFAGSSKLTEFRGDTVRLLGETIWSSVLPAVIARPLQLMGIEGPNGSARSKATIDVIKFMALNDMLPSEEEIAGQANPALFQEEFLDRVDQMAKQYQLLQALTWFALPATGTMSDLTINEEWEWDTEFRALLDSGMPYEQAYPVWVKNVEARSGEPFNPVKFSPFRSSPQSKIPFAVLETTQAANEWLVDNDEFTRTFALAAPFFMPRKFDVEDDEYVAEAKQRQVNMGLRSFDTPIEYLEELYHNVATPAYHQERTSYLQKRYVLQKNKMDTTDLDRSWGIWFDSFQLQHPVFAQRIVQGTARVKRDATVEQARLLIEAPDLVPQGEHREDILDAMATIVGFRDKLDALTGLRTVAAQKKRDALRYRYWKSMESFVLGKPWLNELYYSVFLPLVSDTWIAKYRAGLVEIDSMAVAA